ncbi:hypothetical protein Pmar_PMAR004214 [Perkinsus marinus ATCC 50983]|uniref:Uncharacterized protein n=1 Tax=Perkinsus marinus (strain ATCC 50983 / TXsc) TaxID=423536 RepID=C5LPM1_PERM5|nr:hypothetical protein Pmar_PMAR004214 [Perkinsus marinus ATCC 50983]EER01341.1 hypothetical protein Pmar_PMAR004214 [Perkinsus marinus ATCC 50983]|eukprot:XP_002768623.1 hypothetical protein Pmar_PMAR004214 [Perkinsus marinus ATCC 50983]
MTIFPWNHGKGNASGYQATTIKATTGWIQGDDDKKIKCGAKSTIGIPSSVQGVVEEARRSITGQALERRQHNAVRLKGVYEALAAVCWGARTIGDAGQIRPLELHEFV